MTLSMTMACKIFFQIVILCVSVVYSDSNTSSVFVTDNSTVPIANATEPAATGSTETKLITIEANTTTKNSAVTWSTATPTDNKTGSEAGITTGESSTSIDIQT